MNTVALIGNIATDIEIRTASTGKSVANFSLAVNDGYGEHKKTHFIKITAFGKTAELTSQYCEKGSKVGITGSIDTGSYEKDGNKVYTWGVIAQSVEFLPKGERAEQQTFGSGFKSVEDNDVPF